MATTHRNLLVQVMLTLALLVSTLQSADSPTEASAKLPIDNSTQAASTVGPDQKVIDKVRKLKAITLLDPPFVLHQGMGGEFTGLLVDVLNEAIKSDTDFDGIEITLADDARFGYEEKPGMWNGIVGALQNGSKADVGVAAFTATSKRAGAVTFTHPIVHAGFRVLYKIPDSWNPSQAMVTLLQPFSAGLWVLLILMFLLVSTGLYIIGRFSPYEDVAFVGRTATYEGLTFPNSLLYTFSSLVWQGYTAAPKSYSGRLLTGVWWVFTVFTIGAYIAGLVVVLFKVDPQIRTLPFSTLDEMTRQTKVGVMVANNSAAHIYLKRSEDKMAKRILGLITANEKELIVKNIHAGIKKMMDSDGKFALLMGGPEAEYEASLQPCDKLVLGEPLGDHTYAFACRNNSDVCPRLDKGILAMKERGKISVLKEKWFFGGCYKDKPDTYIYQGLPFFDTFGGEPDLITPLTITIKRFSAAFIMLTLGIILATACLVVEILYARKRGTAIPRRMDGSGRDDDLQKIDNEFHDDRNI